MGRAAMALRDANMVTATGMLMGDKKDVCVVIEYSGSRQCSTQLIHILGIAACTAKQSIS